MAVEQTVTVGAETGGAASVNRLASQAGAELGGQFPFAGCAEPSLQGVVVCQEDERQIALPRRGVLFKPACNQFGEGVGGIEARRRIVRRRVGGLCLGRAADGACAQGNEGMTVQFIQPETA